MACTFTALILRGRQAHSVHVADSRLCRLRDGSLIRQTTDHVPERGAIRNILTRARSDTPATPAAIDDRARSIAVLAEWLRFLLFCWLLRLPSTPR
jgi:serine/threonine protein phosphatase PrpC